MNYDDWKLRSPEEDGENECNYCGNPCEGMYCNNECKKADDED